MKHASVNTHVVLTIVLIAGLLALISLGGCANEDEGPAKLGEVVFAPLGWYTMCAEDPEAFSCPQKK